jgi:putative ABC transport system ATP-binding protein
MLRRTQIGFVFQRFNLLGVLSAADNVAISLRVRRLTADGRVAELFERLGIAHVARRKPGQMSIGEQQRVAVARALAHRPALLLADEPTGNLDSDNGRALLDVFRLMNRQENQTVVMITHSEEAARCADRVVHMKDGRILDP